MDDSEVIILVISGLIAGVAWVLWYAKVFSVQRIRPVPLRSPILLAPVAGSLILFGVLRTLASADVRNDTNYLFFYMVMGWCWIGLAILFLPFAGVSMRDDAIERQNPAAAAVVIGAVLALVFCFAGGNIGNGPGWWVVVFCALLSTLGLFGLWIVLQVVTGVSDSVTIGRDQASGVRLAAFLIAVGLILGRAVAGDWHSYNATITDFIRFGWPVLVLLAVAVIAEFLLQPTVAQPFRPVLTFGVAPAVIYIAAAVLILILTPLSLSLAQ